jgi:hypothetical protein
MFDSPALEVALGLMFVFLTLSLLASGLSEMGAALFHRRERFLKAGIEHLVGLVPSLGGRPERLYSHPRIQELVRPPLLGSRGAKERFPATIPAPVFASALLDVLTDEAASDDPAQHEALTGAVSALPLTHPLRAPIERLVNAPRQDLDAVRAEVEAHRPAIEQWFRSAMDRVRDWYGLQVRWILLACGLGMAVLFNVDTFAVAKGLWGDTALREAAAQAATAAAQQGAPAAPANASEAAARIGDLSRLALPMGWKFGTGTGPPDTGDLRRWPGTDWNRYPGKLLGLLVTGLAVMLGAPFWFDLLSKVVNLRATGRSSHDPPTVRAPAAPAPSTPAPSTAEADNSGVSIKVDDDGAGLDVEVGEPLPELTH